MRRIVLLAIALAVSLALGTGSASAATVICGQVITQSTTLDNDLIDCPQYGLIIGADNITLDLNGHMIDGVSFDGFFSSIVGIENRADHRGVTVENGTVQEFDAAVLMGGAGNLLRDLTAIGGESAGMILENLHSSRLERVHASGTPGSAIYLASSSDNVILDSTTGRPPPSIYGGDLAFFSGSDHNVIERSSLTNGGIRIGSNRNLVRRNLLSGGSDAGIGVFPGSEDNVFEKNSVSGFSLGIVAGGTMRLEDNDVFDNRGDGFEIDTSGVVLVKNRAYRNRGDGIHVLASGATLTRNIANDNSNLGIEAVAGTFDGGGNKAYGNGNPAQCVGVTCK